MKRAIQILILLLPLAAGAVTRTVTINAPTTMNTGQSQTISIDVSTDAGGGEQIGFFHVDQSVDGGTTWTGSYYGVDVGTVAATNVYLTAGAVGTIVKVRVRIAFRGGSAGDVDYSGNAIAWGTTWDSWSTPPTTYASIDVVTPPPNQPPTATWIQTSNSVPINQSFTIQARGNDTEDNLHGIFVWREWAPFSFVLAGDGTELFSDPAPTSESASGTVNFQSRAEDTTDAHSAILYHSVNVTTSAPSAPDWWATEGVLDSNSTANDFAAVNLGQLKNIAVKAVANMNTIYVGGAGSTLSDLIASWSTTPPPGVVRNDYAAINEGQLKALAKLFYDRLDEVGYSGQPLTGGDTYPWSSTTSDDNPYTTVNIGQVKYLFSFQPVVVNADADNDGLPDAWELTFLGGTSYGPDDNNDNDGLTNLQEWTFGSHPQLSNTDNDAFSDLQEFILGMNPQESPQTDSTNHLHISYPIE